jgi:hypothetical protein
MELKTKVYMHDRMTARDVIGKYAYNPNWNYGGIVQEANERGVVVGGRWYGTITGNSVFDSLVINGFILYEPK